MAKRPTRLRFTEDDLSSDAVKKAAGKAEKAAAKAEKAVDKITPKKHRKLRQEADVSASRTAKLRFGKAKADDIPPKPSGIKRTVTHAPVDTLSANVHKSISRYEDDNVGVQTAHQTELGAETAYHTIAVKGSALIFLLWRSTSMDRIFMDEYYEHLRADNIEAFSKERNDEYVGRAEEYKAAKSALLEGLGLEHLFDHSHELTPKEKEIWMLFDRVDVAELLARDAFAKGAYMLGAEDREIMLK